MDEMEEGFMCCVTKRIHSSFGECFTLLVRLVVLCGLVVRWYKANKRTNLMHDRLKYFAG